MIEITCLTGPHAGQTLTPPSGTTPAGLFASLVRHSWTWEVDYSAATDEEILGWFRAEIGARITRALRAGLPVGFLGRQYRVPAGGDLAAVAGELEDDIVGSGRLVMIDSDDEQGLVIGVRGYEFLAE